VGDPGTITNYANNDGWHDDTSDGPVTAQVTLKDGRTFEAQSAWVIVAPPKFAPYLLPVPNLYEVLRDTWYRQDPTADVGEVEYFRDIHPILSRVMGYGWVQDNPSDPDTGTPIVFAHRPLNHADFTSQRMVDLLSEIVTLPDGSPDFT